MSEQTYQDEHIISVTALDPAAARRVGKPYPIAGDEADADMQDPRWDGRKPPHYPVALLVMKHLLSGETRVVPGYVSARNTVIPRPPSKCAAEYDQDYPIEGQRYSDVVTMPPGMEAASADVVALILRSDLGHRHTTVALGHIGYGGVVTAAVEHASVEFGEWLAPEYDNAD